MNKSQLVAKIKEITKEILANKSTNNKYISLDVDPKKGQFLYLEKFPSFKKIIVDLLTDKYSLFITDIEWVAPKPTTFKVTLTNNQFIFISYEEKSWVVTIESKRYWMSNLKEKQNATQALARVLRFGTQQKEESPTPQPPSGKPGKGEEAS